jgi:hypothetical protein
LRARKTIKYAFQLVAAIICLLLLIPGSVLAGKKCEKIVQEFVLNSVSILRDCADPLERLEHYKSALRQLAKDARSVYGPFCPCDEFLSRAAALQNHREAWRSPPPGWDPKKFSDSFRPLEIELARKDVLLMMELMGLCDGS